MNGFVVFICPSVVKIVYGCFFANMLMLAAVEMFVGSSKTVIGKFVWFYLNLAKIVSC